MAESGGMQIGDLVRLGKQINFAPDNKDILGIIVDKKKIKSSDKKETMGIEYEVSIITNNKRAWYISDSLELVNEGWRFG